jgi:serine/threonine protein kinase
MSPEYATFGELSTKVDVYSFGVLLLEIISGRKAILESATDKVYLVKWAWLLHKENMLMNLVDQKINDTLVEIEVQRVINVALLCVQIESTKRPSMSQVLAMLQGEMDLLNISSCQNITNVSSIMDVSTKESNYLLSYPMANHYSNAEIELTNLDSR